MCFPFLLSYRFHFGGCKWGVYPGFVTENTLILYPLILCLSRHHHTLRSGSPELCISLIFFELVILSPFTDYFSFSAWSHALL